MKNLTVLTRLIIDFIYYRLLNKRFKTKIFDTLELIESWKVNKTLSILAFKLYQY